MSKITYREAINTSLFQEMDRDPSVFVYGLDVTDHKGIFGSTKGLADKFGPERCFITPLAEDAMTGFGLGAAINGLRPVHVHQRVDFMMLAVNQISNMLSTCRYMSGGKLKIPMTIRGVIGRGWGQSCQHSKSMHSMFAHIPGIKVVLPTTPRDAKGLIAAAVRDDNPVIVIEHRLLYDIFGEVQDSDFTIPLGKANIVRQGRDLTVISVSWMNVEALKAAEVLYRKHGADIEIVDPRTVYPLDESLLTNSVKKTGHCIVADYDWIFCGFSAEISAIISEKCFYELKSPVTRLGFAHTPCPTTRPLENKFYPNAVDIIRMAEAKLGLNPADLSDEEFFSYENNFKGPF
ncbi:MAG: alpha-ketoacid dehydrogenase subunit beta [Desulfobacterales bacterium]|nr:alpha-ketoacid dehydrogenase subunit beta [Desulfobacterales bacterium]